MTELTKSLLTESFRSLKSCPLSLPQVTSRFVRRDEAASRGAKHSDFASFSTRKSGLNESDVGGVARISGCALIPSARGMRAPRSLLINCALTD
jgi:hypothetical protein